MDWNSILTIALAVITIANFVLGRGDKGKQDTADRNYRQGQLDEKLKTIFEKLEKIERKLDSYDIEIETQIDKAIKIHINQYHTKVKGD